MLDIGSTWWIQLIFFILLNSLVYGLLESWRHFPFIWAYISLIVTVVETPFAVLSENSVFLKIKYFIVCPILVIECFLRITYIPCDEETSPKWKWWMSKLAKAFSRKIFCVKPRKSPSDENEVNTTKCIEYFAWTVGSVNIIVAVVSAFFKNAGYLNAICGVFLSISLPVPAKLLYNKHGYYMANEPVYDLEAPIHWLWIVTFTLWDLTFVWGSDGWTHIFISTMHLLPICARSLINKESHKLWIELRIVALAIFLWFLLAMPETHLVTIPWFLNTEHFPWWGEISMNKHYVIEIIGGINLFLALVHFVIFIKNIIKQRKITEDNKEDQMNRATSEELEALH
eukprot:128695_1